MRINAPPISEHRLQRYQRWALLWLKWFAVFLTHARASAPLSAQASAIAHQWLDRIERTLISIVILRAAPRVRVTNTPKHSARRRTETHMRRAIMGGAMRRALRSKNLQQRIAALSTPVDVLVSRLLQRLPRGLTCRRPIRTRREARPIGRVITNLEAACFADTS